MFASQPYYEHGQFSCLVDTTCFLCNSKFSTNVLKLQSSSQTTRFKVLFFCDTFALTSDEEKEEILHYSQFGEPFCPICSQKVTQLQDWSSQLELLQKGIDDLKDDVRKLVTISLPKSIGTDNYQLKLKIIKNCTLIPENDAGDYFEEISESMENAEDIPNEDEWTPERSPEALNYSPASADSDPTPRTNGEKVKRRKWKESKPKRRSGAFRGHREKKLADPSGQCHLCPTKLPTKFAISRHIKRCHSGINYPCRYCEKNFHETSNRNCHERVVHLTTSKDFVCELCGKAYKRKCQLTAHKREKHEGIVIPSRMPKTSQCAECGRLFRSPKDLKAHMRRMHTQLELKPCPICARPFKTSIEIKLHLKSHKSPWERKLTEGKTFFYKCDMCPLEDQLGFNSKLALQAHYKELHPEHKLGTEILSKEYTKPMSATKKYFCTICPLHPGFIKKTYLTKHINYGHKQSKPIGGNPFPCKICGKPLKTRPDAKNHELTHLPNGFLCPLCSTITLTSVDMKLHYVDKHTNESMPSLETIHIRKEARLFICQKCPNHIGYTSSERLRGHLRTAHGEYERAPLNKKIKIDKEKFMETDKEEHSESKLIKRYRKGKSSFYKCDICGPENDNGYNSKMALYYHYREFHPEYGRPNIYKKEYSKPLKKPKRFFCEVCPHRPGFTESCNLLSHINAGHSGKGKNTNCTICGRPHRTTAEAKDHEVTHHPKGFLCHLCDELTLNSIQMTEHYAVMHPRKKRPKMSTLSLRQNIKKLVCQICLEERAYTSIKNYDSHMRRVHKIKKSYSELRSMYDNASDTSDEENEGNEPHEPDEYNQSLKVTEIHIDNVEESDEEDGFFYKCNLCSPEKKVSYNSKKGLQAHYKEVHPGHRRPSIFRKVDSKPLKKPKRFFCEVCPHRPGFTERCNLLTHIKAGHRGNGMKTVCTVCGRPNRSTADAKDHGASHHPKGYLCHICDELTLRSLEMKRHYTEYHPTKKMPKLATLSLRRDIEKHFCPFCPEGRTGYTSKHNLGSHIRSVHKKRRNDSKIQKSYGNSLDASENEYERSEYEDEQSEEEETRESVHHINVDKECWVTLGERVDSKWPRGKVRRIKMDSKLLDCQT